MPQMIEVREYVELALATEVLRSFGELRFIARGASMLPSIFPGDILVVSRQTAGNVSCGQVVLTSRDARFYAHRLVGKLEQGGQDLLITQGDALADEDPPVPQHDLLGRVTAVIRGKRRIELRDQPPSGVTLLRWAVRNSDGLVRWLLRWNSLRIRITRTLRTARATRVEEGLECL